MCKLCYLVETEPRTRIVATRACYFFFFASEEKNTMFFTIYDYRYNEDIKVTISEIIVTSFFNNEIKRYSYNYEILISENQVQAHGLFLETCF
jgi:hypothetical protein